MRAFLAVIILFKEFLCFIADIVDVLQGIVEITLWPISKILCMNYVWLLHWKIVKLPLVKCRFVSNFVILVSWDTFIDRNSSYPFWRYWASRWPCCLSTFLYFSLFHKLFLRNRYPVFEFIDILVQSVRYRGCRIHKWVTYFTADCVSGSQWLSPLQRILFLMIIKLLNVEIPLIPF